MAINGVSLTMFKDKVHLVYSTPGMWHSVCGLHAQTGEIPNENKHTSCLECLDEARRLFYGLAAFVGPPPAIPTKHPFTDFVVAGRCDNCHEYKEDGEHA